MKKAKTFDWLLNFEAISQGTQLQIQTIFNIKQQQYKYRLTSSYEFRYLIKLSSTQLRKSKKHQLDWYQGLVGRFLCLCKLLHTYMKEGGSLRFFHQMKMWLLQLRVVEYLTGWIHLELDHWGRFHFVARITDCQHSSVKWTDFLEAAAGFSLLWTSPAWSSSWVSWLLVNLGLIVP